MVSTDLSSNTVIDEEYEDELYNQMKDLPDFLNYPFPKHWYKKYNIPLLGPENMKQTLENNYAYKCMVAPKDLPPLIIRKPIDNGRFPDVKIPEPDVLIVEEKPFDPETTNLVGLPFIPTKE